jgi:DNA-binding GntR family transcriptional regulator
MSRQNDLFKKTVNQLLQIITQDLTVGDLLPVDSQIAQRIDVSRSTVRKSIEHLIGLKVISKQGTKRIVLRPPSQTMYFNDESIAESKGQQVERFFLSAILSGNINPGDQFSELELARQSGCNTVAVREFLIRFSRFGLIEKKPRSQWKMKTFDKAFVDQLFEVRYLFEMHALSNFMLSDEDDPNWQLLQALLDDHKYLVKQCDRSFQQFSELDNRFHTLLHAAQPNQFIDQFSEIINFVCHYHYQWDKSDEDSRNLVALDEHIDVIDRMLLKDIKGAKRSLGQHLKTAKHSLMRTAFYRGEVDPQTN